MTKYHYQAIIPTRPSERYPTFGVEIIVPASTYAEAKTVEWIERGSFPTGWQGVPLFSRRNSAMAALVGEALGRGWEIDLDAPLKYSADYRTFPACVHGPIADTLMRKYTKGYTVREYRRILTGQWDSDVIRNHPHWGVYWPGAAEDYIEGLIKALRTGEEPLPLMGPHKSFAELTAEVSR